MAKRGRPRKSGSRTKSGRLSRAARRIAERTLRNAQARGEAIEAAENRPKRHWSTTKTQLELLEIRGQITAEHRKAGERMSASIA